MGIVYYFRKPGCPYCHKVEHDYLPYIGRIFVLHIFDVNLQKNLCHPAVEEWMRLTGGLVPAARVQFDNEQVEWLVGASEPRWVELAKAGMGVIAKRDERMVFVPMDFSPELKKGLPYP
jgi:hypothetical protein